MSSPRLIHINGPAGIGKDTLAHRYIAERPLALCIGTDQIIASIGQWQEHELEARAAAFGVAAAMAKAHLLMGHDVILPHLMTDPAEALVLASIANVCKARFVEIALHTGKPDAVRRMLARGTWGEPNAPPVTEADKPIIEELYEGVQAVTAQRPVITIQSVENDIDGTYQHMVAAIESH